MEALLRRMASFSMTIGCLSFLERSSFKPTWQSNLKHSMPKQQVI